MNIVLLVGPPGSGKSSHTEMYTNQYVIINQDKLGKEGHLNRFFSALENKENIVIDRMNFSKEQRDRYLVPAKAAGYSTEIIVLHQSYETCLKRCNDRNDHPTIRDEEHAKSALKSFFKAYERPRQDEANCVTYVYPEQKLKLNTIIVDLDSTLCNNDHREHFVRGTEKKNWPAFFDAMSLDTKNEWCAKIINSMRPNSIITLCSGRPDSYKELTKNWLLDNKVIYDNLYMRPNYDMRSDTVIKEIILDYEILTRYNAVLFAIDDRKCVIDMYRSRGLTVLDCAGEKGNF